MRVGPYASTTSRRSNTAKPHLNMSALFDWVADSLRLATPENVLRALRSVDGSDYCEFIGDYVPRRYYAEVQQFKRMSPEERAQSARQWFDSIEPGFMNFRGP